MWLAEKLVRFQPLFIFRKGKMFFGSSTVEPSHDKRVVVSSNLTRRTILRKDNEKEGGIMEEKRTIPCSDVVIQDRDGNEILCFSEIVSVVVRGSRLVVICVDNQEEMERIIVNFVRERFDKMRRVHYTSKKKNLESSTMPVKKTTKKKPTLREIDEHIKTVSNPGEIQSIHILRLRVIKDILDVDLHDAMKYLREIKSKEG